MSSPSKAVDVLAVLDEDQEYTLADMQSRVRRQVAMARDWQRKLILALTGSEDADAHPEAARWQRNARMARARRIREEYAALARCGAAP